MEFKSITKSTLSEKIARQIARMVREGDYKAGDRLPTINDMAGQFGVGHPTLRESLKKLETLGVVEVKHGSGVYVRGDGDQLLVSNPLLSGEVSKDILLDLIEARSFIETQSARQAAQNATSEHICRMEELLERAGNHIDDDKILTETNMAFHQQVAVASGNVVVGQILKVLSTLFEHEQRTLLNIYGSRQKDHEEHWEIFEAIQAGNEDQSEQRMRTHLKGVHEMIQQWDPEQSPSSDV